MRKQLFDQFIIVISQWKIFGEEQYIRQFERLLNQLMHETGTTFEGAVSLLEDHINGVEVAAHDLSKGECIA